jgi:hypothetical protein
VGVERREGDGVRGLEGKLKGAREEEAGLETKRMLGAGK